MNLLRQTLNWFNLQSAAKKRREKVVAQSYQTDVTHSLWMPTPNRYIEHDIGFKLIKMPDGSKQRVRTRKVADTGGVAFYVFDESFRF